jgi:hypothetical protein
VPPLDYVPFVDLMRRAYMLIIGFSGVSLPRENPVHYTTERPERWKPRPPGFVGTDPKRIKG